MAYPDGHKMYYLAILCPPTIDSMVKGFKQFMHDRYGCSAAMKSPAHITLVAPFWLSESMEAQLIHSLQSFHSDMDPLEIHLSGFDHFNRRVLFINVVPDPALTELHEQVSRHFIFTFPQQIKKDPREFHPHVTIATRDLQPADFLKAWEYFSSRQYVASFEVESISLLKLGASKWEPIASQKW